MSRTNLPGPAATTRNSPAIANPKTRQYRTGIHAMPVLSFTPGHSSTGDSRRFAMEGDISRSSPGRDFFVIARSPLRHHVLCVLVPLGRARSLLRQLIILSAIVQIYSRAAHAVYAGHRRIRRPLEKCRERAGRLRSCQVLLLTFHHPLTDHRADRSIRWPPATDTEHRRQTAGSPRKVTRPLIVLLTGCVSP